MNREIARLLGGYATGTLTSEEREALFAAALEDQEVFDALVREQPLQELLSDPAARAHLLAALDGASVPWYRRAPRWLAPALAAGLCAAVAVGIWHARRVGHEMKPPPVLTAMRQAPPAMPMAAPPPAAPSQAAAPPIRRHLAAKAVASGKAAPAPAPPPPPPAVAPAPAAQAAAAPVVRAVNGRMASAPILLEQQFARAEVLLGTVRHASAEVPVLKAPLAPVAPSVTWSFWRLQPDGQLAKVDANELAAGEAAVLRLEARQMCYVSVTQTTPGPADLIRAERLQPNKPLDIPIAPGGPGQRELRVTVTPELVTGMTGAFLDQASAGVQNSAQTAGPATFAITLTYK
jgi:hypothetical protein